MERGANVLRKEDIKVKLLDPNVLDLEYAGEGPQMSRGKLGIDKRQRHKDDGRRTL